MPDLTFSCTCGQVRGTVKGAGPGTGTALVCCCRYCRAAEVYLDQDDPGGDGVNIFQTTADRVEISAGQERLDAFSFSDRGLVRWYARCCKAPLFNTPRSARWGMVSVMADRIDGAEELGPIRAVLYEPQESGKRKTTGAVRAVAGLLKRTAKMQITGGWKNSPLFGKSGRPVVKIAVLPDVVKSHLPLDEEAPLPR